MRAGPLSREEAYTERALLGHMAAPDRQLQDRPSTAVRAQQPTEHRQQRGLAGPRRPLLVTGTGSKVMQRIAAPMVGTRWIVAHDQNRASGDVKRMVLEHVDEVEQKIRSMPAMVR
jgi:hypothetical protein